MKAVLCKRHGPPQTLVVEEVPSLVPGEGEVVVAVHAAAVNFPDTLIIENKYQFKPTLPFSPGGEVAGHLPGEHVSVYVPTTPNPTSGFFLMMPRSEVITLAMSVDEALKYIISMGVVAPGGPAGTDAPAALPARN